ncbi:MAG: transposase [Paludibacteraceae bacterium]|nr:transposase [Paludibacteraceae bacterium]
MPQSLSKVYLHLVFHIKTISPQIRETDLERVHAYIGQLVNKTGCVNIWVGGIEDHVHVLCLLSRNETISHLVEEIKRNSSRWIKTIDERYYKNFAWQSGYGCFSVSQSVVDKTLAYIKNQSQHHKNQSFEAEYKSFLTLYEVDYDEEYLFRD